MNSNEKVYVFWHLHTSSSGNGYYPILSIKTGNAHKERKLSPTVINTLKKCKEVEGGKLKTDAGG